MTRLILLAASVIALGATGVARQVPEESREGALVVVHPRAFSEALAEFVAWRAKDLPVEPAVLEDILERGHGVDAAEKLKRFLFAAWKERHRADPSGIAEPSRADELITMKIREALALIDVRLLDHLIVGQDVYSFAEHGLM